MRSALRARRASAPTRTRRTNSVVTWSGYDGAQRLVQSVHQYVPGPGYADTLYAYNPASQIVSRSLQPEDGYAWTGHYNDDRDYTANGLNQYTQTGTSTFGYDANGNYPNNTWC